ncbi:helix-turn-helix domain-containing protein [Sneathiella chinensis]|uniref:Helix-turn-helix domain-containing protein n=1 Tax=Sneathiella chinensis TaxID=349750 RepID=A0ABQ5U385_9PROT|nr:hypothetical protein GCM10007924_10920 [Sneathiella chinensis]
MSTERITVTVQEAGNILGIGKSAAYHAVKSGKIPSIRIGRRILIPKEPLMELLNNPPAQISTSTLNKIE